MRYLLACFVLTATLWGQAAKNDAERQAAEIYGGYLDDPRNAIYKPDQVIAALNISPTEVIATIEADGGYFARRFASVAGQVYVIGPRKRGLDYAKLDTPGNVQTVQSSYDDPKAPAQTFDTIFIHDSVQRIRNRSNYYTQLAQSLKAGGRLVLINRKKHVYSWFDGTPLDENASGSEIRVRGFRLVQEFNFLPYEYFLVFEKK